MLVKLWEKLVKSFMCYNCKKIGCGFLKFVKIGIYYWKFEIDNNLNIIKI